MTIEYRLSADQLSNTVENTIRAAQNIIWMILMIFLVIKTFQGCVKG